MRLLPGLLLLLSFPVLAQSITFNGYVRDERTGEVLIGASVAVPSQKIGTTTNHYGFYSLLALTADSLNLVVSYVGYRTSNLRLLHPTSQQLNLTLTEAASQLNEVLISDQVTDQNIRQTQMGSLNLSLKLNKTLPALFGERDILKTVQLLPGVQGGQEGTTGFYVRGGNSDQNLVQLDEAPVYNPNHLFGLFSTFNTNALNRVTLIKGGFPAQYGGRLSSILDVTMREGNSKKFSGQGGIGLIASNLTLEGPISGGRGSYMISGRRTYLDLLLKPFLPKNGKTNYTFYDFNAKINYRLGERDRLFLSVFTGRDNAQYTGASSLNYGIRFGNNTATFRWNHLFSNTLFANTSLITNTYQLSLSTLQSGYVAQIYTGLRDYTLKSDWEYYPSPKHTLRWGGIVTNHAFAPLASSARLPKSGKIPVFPTDSITRQYATEAGLYLNDDWILTERAALSAGLRLPLFRNPTATYARLEPRLSVRYLLGTVTSLKVSYSIMNQFLHLVPNSTASLPADIWLPSSAVVRPQTSQQIAVGWFRNSRNNAFEMSIEAYAKEMRGQVLFREGTQLLKSSEIEQNLAFGRGWSIGLEFYLRKNAGRFTGWLSYTLSKTMQQFANLNRGKAFPFAYDRRHNLALVGSYELSSHWTVAGNLTFYTGRPYTLPVGRVQINGGSTLYNDIYADYTSRNNYRLRPYHRLDVSVTHKKNRTWFGHPGTSEWVFSTYNLYSRLNPYFVYATTDDFTRQPIAREVSLLPIIPSVSYQISF
ncbi:TonB-dependent receptor [Larkinella sp. C7]|uniref:TonB-dependent receptor n=1 Tax=Larkinella sp. C7 TaxID=2576607 RepID=UPI0011115F53|nr:TonB-dependent receptor [Larkinella sp. C7]